MTQFFRNLFLAVVSLIVIVWVLSIPLMLCLLVSNPPAPVSYLVVGYAMLNVVGVLFAVVFPVVKHAISKGDKP